MTRTKVYRLFSYNQDYIFKNHLSNKLLKKHNIDYMADEVFVRHPNWTYYYVSNYGRVINNKNGKMRLLGLLPGGNGSAYYFYKFSEPNRPSASISAHRAVADVFLPNYWPYKARHELQTHHSDHNKTNNYYKNLVLLPVDLHYWMNRVDKIVYFVDGTFQEMTVYEILQRTGLSMEEIILPMKNMKPVNNTGKYTVYDVQGHLIGFRFLKNKKPKNMPCPLL